MENALTYTLILLIAELFEVYIQRAPTLLGILSNLYAYYQKSVFLFFLVQPGLYLILFVILLTGVLNTSMIFLLALKVFDLFYKIELIKNIFIQKNISLELKEMLTWKMPSWFLFIGMVIYPSLIFLALI